MKERLNNLLIRYEGIKDGYKFNTLTKVNKDYCNYNQFKYIKYESLYDCYKKPSYYKEIAYDYCLELLNIIQNLDNCYVKNYGISGYNCMQFTYKIDFTYNMYNYTMYITKSYNRIISDENGIRNLLRNAHFYKDNYNEIYYIK